MMELISVIVPVYKVEPYLDRCIQSIVDQTYTNLEIILVDDGSPDNCGAMCDAWTQKDSRIKVIHKENAGVSAARNSGIDVSKGEYLCFVDSDDWIHEKYVDCLYHAITAYNASVSVCGIQTLTAADAVTPPATAVARVYSSEEGMFSLVNGGVFIGTVWDKLYRRDAVGEIRFPLGKRHEDEFFVQNVFARIERLVYVDSELYYYFQQNNSFMHTITLEHLDMLDAWMDRICLVEKQYPTLLKNAKAVFCLLCVMLCRDALEFSSEETGQYIKQIKERRNKIKFTVRELRSYPLKKMIYIAASRMCLVSFARFLNSKNGGK